MQGSAYCMRGKRQAPTPAISNEKKHEVQRLLQESGEVAPVDLHKHAKRAAEVITRAVEKARAHGAQKARR
jgi:hypothetical protein